VSATWDSDRLLTAEEAALIKLRECPRCHDRLIRYDDNGTGRDTYYCERCRTWFWAGRLA
jgi:uncharacterized protein with PIN domain